MSKLHLYVCDCDPLVRVRSGHDDIEIMCLVCMQKFTKVEQSPTNKRRPRK